MDAMIIDPGSSSAPLRSSKRILKGVSPLDIRLMLVMEHHRTGYRRRYELANLESQHSITVLVAHTGESVSLLLPSLAR